LDLAIELPGSPLEAVMSNEVWEEVYGRLADLIDEHKTTLVFVNTRRLAERVAHQLGSRLGSERVMPHHGSLSAKLRHEAENRLKRGELRALVATASLELGIDIGSVDQVCPVGPTHSLRHLFNELVAQNPARRPAEAGARSARTNWSEAVLPASFGRELDNLEIPQSHSMSSRSKWWRCVACKDWDEGFQPHALELIRIANSRASSMMFRMLAEGFAQAWPPRPVHRT
jgi:ATP-dependent Lhr-like helicase